MGFEHIALVREVALPAVQKLLLYALASRANVQGRCWPSVERLCRDTGLSRRAVQIHLGRLIQRGVVERRAQVGRSSEYGIDMPTLRSLDPAEQLQTHAASGGQLADEARMPCAPPAHVVRNPAHRMRDASAAHAPEVTREVPLNNQKQATREALAVDNSDSAVPWWRSRSAVMLMGAQLGVAAAPGEEYAQYKDRVYRIWRASLYQLRNTRRGKNRSQS